MIRLHLPTFTTCSGTTEIYHRGYCKYQLRLPLIRAFTLSSEDQHG